MQKMIFLLKFYLLKWNNTLLKWFQIYCSEDLSHNPIKLCLTQGQKVELRENVEQCMQPNETKSLSMQF